MRLDPETGAKTTIPLDPEWVRTSRDGLDVYEVTVTAEEFNGSSFLADVLPANCEIHCRVVLSR